MDKNYLISIIVPVYNAEKYLDRCIESIVNQTYNNLEIILVDDGSVDNCPQICDKWAKKDRRIKVIHKENGGVSSARNAGLDIACGEYIGFVDSDDYIEYDMYEILKDIISLNNSDIAVCDYRINNESIGDKSVSIINLSNALKKIAFGDNKYGVLWNKLYKKKVIKDIKIPDLKYSEDLVFNFYAFKNSKNIIKTDLKLYNYYQNEESAVHQKFDKSNYDAVIARKIILDNCDKDIRINAVYGYLLSCYVFLNRAIENNQLTEMQETVRKDILIYSKTVLLSNIFSIKDKIKIIILSFSLNFYKKIFLKFC